MQLNQKQTINQIVNVYCTNYIVICPLSTVHFDNDFFVFANANIYRYNGFVKIHWLNRTALFFISLASAMPLLRPVISKISGATLT